MALANPVLVEVTRGSVVESRHRGAVAVIDLRGRRLPLGEMLTRWYFPARRLSRCRRCR